MISPLPCILWSKNPISSPSSSSNEPHLKCQSRDWLTWEETPGSHLTQPLLLKQGCLEPVAQHYVQTSSKCLQGWRLRNPSVPVFDNPPSKSCFLTLRASHISACAHCLLSWPRLPLKRALLHLLYTCPSGIFIHQWDPPPRLLFLG